MSKHTVFCSILKQITDDHQYSDDPLSALTDFKFFSPFLDTGKKTVRWRSADLDFVLGVPRNQCSAFTLLPIKTAISWKTKTNQAGYFVNIGVQSFRLALKAKGTITLKTVFDRTVFIPKSSDVDNNGRIVRSPEALRPLTLCGCDCRILTTAICRGLPSLVHYEMQTSFSKISLPGR